MKLFENEVLNKLIKDTLYNSTAQAILKLIETPNVLLKIILLVYLSLASCISSYLVIQSTLSYLSWQVFTTTTTYFENPAVFPKITICNRSPFKTKYALDLLKELNKEISPNLDLFDSHNISRLDYTSKQSLADKIRQAGYAKMNNRKFSDEDRKRLSHSKEDSFISCSFNGQACSPEDLVWEFDKRYGNCYVYNSGISDSNPKDANVQTLKSAYLSGSDFGLRLTFYAGHHENLSIINSLFANGIKIRIENSSYLSENSNGIRISNGYETDVSIERFTSLNLPKPYSSCDIENQSPKYEYDSSYLYNLILNSSYNYNQQLCLRLWRQQITIRECNCTDPRYFPSYFFNITSLPLIKKSVVTEPLPPSVR